MVNQFAVVSDFTPTAMRFIKLYGDKIITRVRVGRKPIANWIDRTLNFLSLGSWDTLKAENNYDSFFHLYVILSFNNSEDLTLEKNNTITLGKTTADQLRDPAMIMNCPDPPRDLTLNTLIKKTMMYLGNKFFYYEGLGSHDGLTEANNCQTFAMGILASNNILTSELSTFITQNIEDISMKLPLFVKRLARSITDLGGVVETVQSIYQEGKEAVSDFYSKAKRFVGLKHGGFIKTTKTTKNRKRLFKI